MADKITNMEAVNAYREQAAHKSDFERSELAKEKTGVPLEGITAINPGRNYGCSRTRHEGLCLCKEDGTADS